MDGPTLAFFGIGLAIVAVFVILMLWDDLIKRRRRPKHVGRGIIPASAAWSISVAFPAYHGADLKPVRVLRAKPYAHLLPIKRRIRNNAARLVAKLAKAFNFRAIPPSGRETTSRGFQ